MLNYYINIFRFLQNQKLEMKEDQILKLNQTPTVVNVLRRGMSGMAGTVSTSLRKKTLSNVETIALTAFRTDPHNNTYAKKHNSNSQGHSISPHRQHNAESITSNSVVRGGKPNITDLSAPTQNSIHSYNPRSIQSKGSGQAYLYAFL